MLRSASECPTWCTSNHAPAWPVHLHSVATIKSGPVSTGPVELAIAVTQHDNGDGRAVVSLAVHEGNSTIAYDVTPAAARALADALVTAARLAEVGA